ncbi:MAG: nuclear transport factor 2 family protein [Nitrososphaeria archaeon]|nr:nuclear transport factor 2 family protein [Nitrososphaeria archaeon]
MVSAYESIGRGDVESLIEAYAEGYTLVSELNPGELLEPERAIATRRSMPAQIADLEFKLEEVHTRRIGNDAALVVYRLRYKGILVYQYRFEGAYLEVEAIGTALLVREGERWKIVHEHLTPLTRPLDVTSR